MAWSLNDIDRTTHYNHLYVEDLKKHIAEAERDPRKDMRLDSKECKICFYIRDGRIVTQAFTDYTCRYCGERKTWHNGGTPKICPQCAQEQGLCVQCGGKID